MQWPFRLHVHSEGQKRVFAKVFINWALVGEFHFADSNAEYAIRWFRRLGWEIIDDRVK